MTVFSGTKCVNSFVTLLLETAYSFTVSAGFLRLPMSLIVFVVAGHGRQVADLDGDEEDGFDEGACKS